MDPYRRSILRELGEKLRARHDDAVISDTIGVVDTLEGKNAEITGQILRIMMNTPD